MRLGPNPSELLPHVINDLLLTCTHNLKQSIDGKRFFWCNEVLAWQLHTQGVPQAISL